MSDTTQWVLIVIGVIAVSTIAAFLIGGWKGIEDDDHGP